MKAHVHGSNLYLTAGVASFIALAMWIACEFAMAIPAHF